MPRCRRPRARAPGRRTAACSPSTGSSATGRISGLQAPTAGRPATDAARGQRGRPRLGPRTAPRSRSQPTAAAAGTIDVVRTYGTAHTTVAIPAGAASHPDWQPPARLGLTLLQAVARVFDGDGRTRELSLRPPLESSGVHQGGRSASRDKATPRRLSERQTPYRFSSKDDDRLRYISRQ
jgi:hypothetical protein